MCFVKEIENDELKSQITETVLRDLPEWFGIEEATLSYINGVKESTFYGSYDHDNNLTGFISLIKHNPYTAEIYVVGTLKRYHRQGYGKLLVNHAINELKRVGFKFFMVKTLSDSHSDENYRKTRLFYRDVGFYPLEEIKEIWGKENPCLIMVQTIE